MNCVLWTDCSVYQCVLVSWAGGAAGWITVQSTRVGSIIVTQPGGCSGDKGGIAAWEPRSRAASPAPVSSVRSFIRHCSTRPHTVALQASLAAGWSSQLGRLNCCGTGESA